MGSFISNSLIFQEILRNYQKNVSQREYNVK